MGFMMNAYGSEFLPLILVSRMNIECKFVSLILIAPSTYGSELTMASRNDILPKLCTVEVTHLVSWEDRLVP